jgi:hypothetical protein
MLHRSSTWRLIAEILPLFDGISKTIGGVFIADSSAALLFDWSE